MTETIQTTLTNLPLTHPSPTPPHTHFVHLVHNLLTPSECASIITSHPNLIPANTTPGTVRTREIFTDFELAARMWARMPFYHAHQVVDEAGQSWTAKGLNERFRLCKYDKGGRFSPHMDGRFLRNVDESSWMAVNVYLNTLEPGAGGGTRVLAEVKDGALDDLEVLGSVRPERGMAAVFRDNLWHDGDELHSGEKYLLRTDLMYQRDVPFDFDALGREADAEGNGRKALALAEALEDGGSYDEAMKWYKKAFRLAPELERSG